MVRKKLREKSEKRAFAVSFSLAEKAQVAPSKAATLNPAALTRHCFLLLGTVVAASENEFLIKRT